MAIDYRGFAQPKTGDTPKRRRARRRRKVLAAGAVDRDTQVMNRYGGLCVAHRVSPVCQRRACDPHELIPRSQGGPLESWNREPICRACHRETQGRVGGNRLMFNWPGKAEGQRPNADQPGNVQPIWTDRRMRKAG
jgi:hypothetical protein